jgi:CubicO group peptidase (beta-lactamase class C family)
MGMGARMKLIMKSVLLVAVALLLWSAVVVAGTLRGWWHEPIAEGDSSDAFMQAVEREISAEFVGSFALALMEEGEVQREHFHSVGRAVDRATVFQVASMSKWISAVGVMTLVEDGRIDLDAPVGEYLTRWQLPPSEFENNGVTVRRLLSHTAGLTDGLGYSGFPPGVPVQPLEESLTKAADADEGISGEVRVGAEPGSGFNYSGGGYSLLQLLVEEVTGQSFASYMKEAVLLPLGMLQSSYSSEDVPSGELVQFYDADGSEALHYRYTSLAATSLYTSLADLELFFGMHLDGGPGQEIGRGVLAPETLELMRQPHASTMGLDIWGLGTILFTSTENGDHVVGHDGQSTPPVNTAVRLDPQTGNGIIVLTTGHPDLATRIASEWVFWRMGKLDTLLFTMLQGGMVSALLRGWLVILGLGMLLGVGAWWTRARLVG